MKESLTMASDSSDSTDSLSKVLLLCAKCATQNSLKANFCSHCGQPLQNVPYPLKGSSNPSSSWALFFLSVITSFFLTWLLMKVFRLPVLLFFGVLPLFWFWTKRQN